MLLSEEMLVLNSSDVWLFNPEVGGSRTASSSCKLSVGGPNDIAVLDFWRLVGRAALIARGLICFLALRIGVEISMSEWCFRTLILGGGEGGGAHTLIEDCCMANNMQTVRVEVKKEEIQ